VFYQEDQAVGRVVDMQELAHRAGAPHFHRRRARSGFVRLQHQRRHDMAAGGQLSPGP
jgi:hypothetical protein